MKLELDAPGIFVLICALLGGAAVFAFIFYFGLEEGLRRRKSPNQVRLQAAGSAVLAAGAVGLFGTWGLLYFAVALILAIVLLSMGGGFSRFTLIAFAFALVIAAAGYVTHRPKPKSDHLKTDAAGAPTTPVVAPITTGPVTPAPSTTAAPSPTPAGPIKLAPINDDPLLKPPSPTPARH